MLRLRNLLVGLNSSTDSMQLYYTKLLAPRDDNFRLTRNRLDTLKSLKDARNKILSMNDTVCDSEITLSKALHTCSEHGLHLAAVKFKKMTHKSSK